MINTQRPTGIFQPRIFAIRRANQYDDVLDVMTHLDGVAGKGLLQSRQVLDGFRHQPVVWHGVGGIGVADDGIDSGRQFRERCDQTLRPLRCSGDATGNDNEPK